MIFASLWKLLRARNPFRKKIRAKCGHMTAFIGEMSAFGRRSVYEIKKQEEIEYCIACLERMAICCAWCGETIFIGDPITLYITDNKNFTGHPFSVLYNEETGERVGCLKWDCADSGADRAGFWIPGKDRRGKVCLLHS